MSGTHSAAEVDTNTDQQVRMEIWGNGNGTELYNYALSLLLISATRRTQSETDIGVAHSNGVCIYKLIVQAAVIYLCMYNVMHVRAWSKSV